MKDVIKIYIQSGLKLLSLFIFIYILFFQIDITEIIKIFKNSDIRFILIAVLLLILVHIIKSVRFYGLLRFGEISIPLYKCFLIYVVGLYWGMITPGRMGDVVKAYYVKQQGYSLTRGISATIADRIFDLAFFLVITLFELIILIKYRLLTVNVHPLVFVSAFISVFILIIIFFNHNKFIQLLFRIKVFLKFKEHINIFKSYFTDLLQIKRMIVIIGLTMISWFVYLWVIQILLISYNLIIPFHYTILFFFISTLVSLLPISYAGIGTRDAMLLFLFNLYGYSSENAIQFSFSILFVYICTIIMGVIIQFFIGAPKKHDLKNE